MNGRLTSSEEPQHTTEKAMAVVMPAPLLVAAIEKTKRDWKPGGKRPCEAQAAPEHAQLRCAPRHSAVNGCMAVD
jgi:hypothetical protein